jgi:hypothetical protein
VTGLNAQAPTEPPFVPWDFPEHDDAVKEIINVAWQYAEKMGLLMGVGVLDFADGTVVVLSKNIGPGQMVAVDRRSENHLQAFGLDPFRETENRMPDFTENLVEIKNPDAPLRLAVNRTKP